MKPILSKKFYFIRHAETEANAKRLMCGGEWDIPLNDRGLEQVKLARPIFERINDQIVKLFVSPMERTKTTADLLNENLELPIEYMEGLREWCVGDWERQPWSEVPNPFNTTEDPVGGETRLVFEERVIKTINECLEKVGDQSILFVSHGAVAHTLFTYMGVDTPFIKNATIYALSPKEKHWHLEEMK